LLGSQEIAKDSTDSLFNAGEVIGHTGQVFQQVESTSQHSGENSPQVGESSQHLEGSSQHSGVLAAAALVRKTRNAPAEQIRNLILDLCRGTYRTNRELSDLLSRKPRTLQNHYIGPMIVAGQLEYRYPEQKQHPEQGYRTVETGVL
jgi:ATP-dependent DNA helicase RecG